MYTRAVFQTYQQLIRFRDALELKDGPSEDLSHHLDHLEDKLLHPACRIAVVGEFKRGKSSFINAVLGERILPEAVAPWTAVQTELVSAETESAHIRTAGGEEKKVDRGQLSGWLTQSSEQSEKAAAALIGFPSSFLLDTEAVLVDTPGLNDDGALDARTLDAARDADILIWILSSNSPLSSSESEHVLSLIRASSACHILFIVNKIDAVEEDDRDALLDVVRQRVRGLADTVAERQMFFFKGAIPVFGFSARNALRARKEQDPELLQESGLAQLIEGLEEIVAETYQKKQTTKILAALCQHVSQEIAACDLTAKKWLEEADLLDRCSDRLNALNDFFDESLTEQAKTMGSNCRRQLAACLTSLRCKFHQVIYSRGYEILTACCADANTWGNEQIAAITPDMTASLMMLCHEIEDRFFTALSDAVADAGTDPGPQDAPAPLIEEESLAIEPYLPRFFFSAIDFPGLLLKRDPTARESYLDRIVEQTMTDIAGRLENGPANWAAYITQKMNENANVRIQAQDLILQDRSRKCREDSDSLTDSAYLKALTALSDEIQRLQAALEKEPG